MREDQTHYQLLEEEKVYNHLLDQEEQLVGKEALAVAEEEITLLTSAEMVIILQQVPHKVIQEVTEELVETELAVAVEPAQLEQMHQDPMQDLEETELIMIIRPLLHHQVIQHMLVAAVDQDTQQVDHSELEAQEAEEPVMEQLELEALAAAEVEDHLQLVEEPVAVEKL
jgi:hypothetical protein